jgi:cyanophycinase
MRLAFFLSILLYAYAVPALAGGYLCAEGGGNGRNGVWATSVFAWMVANSQCGDVLVLGVSEPDTRIENVFLEHGAASVTHLSVREGEADREEVYEAITAADIIWIRGGAQSNYVRWWKGTRTEQAIRDVYDRGGVVGGTSAGCAILGEVIFDALEGSLTARQALADPYHINVTLTDDFLQLTPGVLFDSHFTERGRLGRLVTMMGRDREASCRDVLGIGVDYRTALCVYPDFTAEVRGEGSVTILQAEETSQVRVEPSRPPVFTSLRYDQLTEGYRYDLVTRQVLSRPAYASAGRERAPAALSAMEIVGGWPASAVRGESYVDDRGEDSALLHGTLGLRPGTGQVGGLVLSPGTWAASSFAENRMGGAQFALAETPLRGALLFDQGSTVRFEPPARLWVTAAPRRLRRSALILDAERVTSTAASYFVSTLESRGPRQSVALEGAMLHVLPPGMGYDFTTGMVLDGGAEAAEP